MWKCVHLRVPAHKYVRVHKYAQFHFNIMSVSVEGVRLRWVGREGGREGGYSGAH